MESRPHVEAGPPTLIESAVRLFVPPVAREHVLGDLAERYSSPGQYIREAVRTLPFVVTSQIRRTSNFAFWPMVALLLTSGFGAGAEGSWLRGVIPALATMIGFMFRDAYRVPDLEHPWRQGLVDSTVVAASALVSQAIVAAARPEWLMAPAGVAGGGIVLAMLYFLRVQNPTRRVRRLVPAAYGPMTIEQLRSEVAIFDRNLRRGALIEIVTGCVIVPVFVASALFASPLFFRIGAGLTVAGILFVVWYIQRGLKAAVPIHRDADFAAAVTGYRARLERHLHSMRTIWLWYLLPLGVGPAVTFIWAAMAASRPAAPAIGPVITFTVIWVSVAWNAGLKARALRRRIAAIERWEGAAMSVVLRYLALLTLALVTASPALAARGKSLAAFDGRCILAGCVALPSNIPDILGHRALPARRLARLGATPDFHHGLLAQSPTAPSAPSDAEIRKILADRIDVHRQSVGIVVGVVDGTGRRIVAHGKRSANDTHPLDGDTIFEIGSMTKVFTSLLLADAVERKELALTDPVAKYLPDSVKVPQRGRAITLQDLSNHTSGLPRMPSNFAPKDAANPFADYSVEQMYQFLSGYQLPRDVGERYEYSNFGGGLLGHVLARRAGMDYEALVKARITGPLGMRDTGITLTPALKARLTSGHTQALEPTSNWDLPTLAGAGALRSSANDVLTFLAAAIGHTPSPLSAAMSRMLVTRWPTDQGGMEIALGWHTFKVPGGDLIWHNGGTGGYRTFMGYNPRTRVGVVVLSNTSTPAGPDDIGRHLLDASAPLIQNFPPPPSSHVEVKVDPALFDRYVGRYQLAPAAMLTVTRDGGRFLVQLTGQPALEIFAESDKKFFLKVVDAQLTFETDAQNKAIAVVLHQNGIDQRAPRIEGEPVAPKTITLAPEVLDRYTGRYQLTPALVITITRQDARLFAQLTGQPAFEVFASAEREFFFTVVNAQLVFEAEGAGRATAVVLHQNGQTPRALRID